MGFNTFKQSRILRASLLVLLVIVDVSANADTRSKEVSVQKRIKAEIQSNSIPNYRRFEEAFSFLSEIGKVTFVAEGTPYQAELTDEQNVNLERELGELPKDKQGRIAKFDDLVAVVANAYDYEAQHLTRGKRISPTVFTLTKRYTNPEDLPFITIEEATGSLRNIRRSIEKLVSPEIQKADTAVTLADLYRSLTSEQQAIANQDSSEGGLLVGQLNNQQRKLVWTFFANFHFAPLRIFEILEVRLRGCQKPEAVFCRFDYLGVNVFGITGPLGPPNGYPFSIPLSHGFFTQAGGAVGLRIPRNEGEFRDGKFVREPPDADAPVSSTAVRPLVLPLSCVTTLGKFIEQRQQSTNDKVPLVAVDPALAAKPLSLFGAERTETRELLEASAHVYGLYVQPFVQQEPGGKQQGYRITLPVPHILENFEEVPAEIRRLLPAGLTQIPVGGYEGAVKAIAGRPMRTKESPVPSIRETQKKQLGRIGAFQRVYTVALRRLRALIEPKIPKGSDIRIPIIESGEDAKCLVAVTSLVTLGEFADQLTENAVPTYITDINNVFLSIHVQESDRRLKLSFGIKHRDRTNWVVGGMSASPNLLK